jgi:hypothetical protein
MRMWLAAPVAATIAMVATGALMTTAEAQPRRGKERYVYVTAESRYSGATVTAPVRVGPKNRLEVRLPGGTWLECGQSCSDTLRRETVDFWQNHNGRPFDGGRDGPGYLKFRF